MGWPQPAGRLSYMADVDLAPGKPWTASRLRESVRVPLVAAPMFRVSNPKLVIEVCRAGAIGAFPSINARPVELLDRWMAEIKGALAEPLADGGAAAPFAVNLITHDTNPRFEPDFEIVKRWEPPIVITSVGRPEIVLDDVHAYGGLVFADVVSLRHARRAASFGVDGMVLLCAGAGGQTGRLNPMAFVEAVRQFYDGILIVAGGITRGHHVRAVETMGADLAYCGTRFIVTPESGADADHKAAIIAADIDEVWDSDAMSGIPASMLRSSLEKLGLTPETRWLQEKQERYDWSAVKETPGVYAVGQGATDIGGEEKAGLIVSRMIEEYRAAGGR